MSQYVIRSNIEQLKTHLFYLSYVIKLNEALILFDWSFRGKKRVGNTDGNKNTILTSAEDRLSSLLVDWGFQMELRQQVSLMKVESTSTETSLILTSWLLDNLLMLTCRSNFQLSKFGHEDFRLMVKGLFRHPPDAELIKPIWLSSTDVAILEVEMLSIGI